MIMTDIFKDMGISFITSFLVVLVATPSLIKVAKMKHLVDEPGEARKLHRRSVPTLGGVMIFAGTIMSYCMWFPAREDWMGRNYDAIDALAEFKYILTSLFILFFLGLKDDIIGVSPSKKLLVHLIVGSIIVMVADIRITEFWGLFRLDGEMPYTVSVIFSIFVYIVIVNAMNLIDGVDGLAAGVGTIATLTFAYWFYKTGDIPLSLLAIALGGSLCGFLIYNFQPAKLFMGDSGSLIIGLIIFVLAVKMIEFPVQRILPTMKQVSKPVLAMAILCYPLIDTLRVFAIRMFQGRSPFSADKNHIHHKLLSLGFSHRQTSLFLYVFTIAIVGLTLSMPAYSPNVSFAIVGGTAMVVLNSIFFFKKKPTNKVVEKQANAPLPKSA
jgi:UDP-GlcNAc:undecaprenyl-phosphate/decaprenyl-phosphate GlcNAc-1-phosphate transferase